MTNPSDGTPESPLSVLRGWLRYRLPEKTGWAHVLGGLLLLLFGVQLLTGILLALYYSPSASEAWESIRYIEAEVGAGWLIRGIHHWASSAFVVLLGCHLARTFIWAAYKGQRRLTWVVGCLLLMCVLGFGFTGYLLPWDLKAFFGTRVGVEIAGAAPVVGEYLKKFLQGGTAVGPLTLPRFYALHSVVLPLATVLLIALHLILIRRHGIAPAWRRDGLEPELNERGPLYFPDHVAKELAAGAVLLLVLAALATWVGAPLEERADPQNTTYVPRPEWYFLGLQQLLRIFQGRWQLLGTVVLPGLAMSGLFLLPWLDRNPERSPRRRPLALSIGGAVALAAVGLTVWGYVEVQREQATMAQREPGPAASVAGAAGVAAAAGDDVDGGAADLVQRGEALYRALACAGCHEAAGAGTGLGIPPVLGFQGSRAPVSWMRTYLTQPGRIRFAADGVHPVARMPGFQLTEPEAAALAAYLGARRDTELVPAAGADWSVSPTAAEVREGRTLVEQYQCLGCHQLDGEGAEIGPHLDGVGSRRRPDYIYALVLAPQKIVPDTAMKDSGLWEDEALAIVQFLRTLR